MSELVGELVSYNIPAPGGHGFLLQELPPNTETPLLFVRRREIRSFDDINSARHEWNYRVT